MTQYLFIHPPCKCAHLYNAGVVLVNLAAKHLFLEVSYGNQTTTLTYMDPICITLVKQALLQ